MNEASENANAAPIAPKAIIKGGQVKPKKDKEIQDARVTRT